MADGKTAVDIFSGCGGMTLGLKNAGFDVLGAVEIDPLAVETYKANHDEVEVWEADIRKVKIPEMRKKLGLRKGDLYLLAGCPPCQGFSTIRTLNGNKEVPDARNDLILEFLRFVKGFQPKYVMFENVPKVIEDYRFVYLKRELSKMGYVLDYDVLDAADYGVAQRRRRLILVGGKRCTVKLSAKKIRRLTVRRIIGRLSEPGNGEDALHDYETKRSDKVKTLIAKIPKNGGSRTDLGRDEQLLCHKKCDGFKDVYGRMAWDAPAPTITGGCINPSKGRFLHPEGDRAITLREAALIQSFPNDYSFSLKRGRYFVAEMIGNALPPEFVKRHAVTIFKRGGKNG
jgi:DNA (cytosine-5)-methyltransferase 1